MPHGTTGEKLSFLLFGWDCRSPVEVAFLPAENVTPTSVCDYREELMLSLTLARKSALKNIHHSQRKYRTQYDRKSDEYQYQVRDWD